MAIPLWVQNAAALAIVLAAAVWLLRRAIWKKGGPKGCENCPAHLKTAKRPAPQPSAADARSRGGSAPVLTLKK